MVNWQELSSVVSVFAVVFFAGAWWQTTKHNKETVEMIKSSFKESVENIEKNFQERVFEMKTTFNMTVSNIKEIINSNAQLTTEQIKQLAARQDKHNSVIERTVANEASCKAAHKRLDDGERHFAELTQGINDIKNFLIERGQ